MEEELSLLFPSGTNCICEVKFKNYETKEVIFEWLDAEEVSALYYN